LGEGHGFELRQHFGAEDLTLLQVKVTRKDESPDAHFLVGLNFTEHLVHTAHQGSTAVAAGTAHAGPQVRPM
jgi:hypothetical protein